MGRRLWKTLHPGATGHSGTAGPETTYLAYSDEGYAAEFTLPGTPAEAPVAGPSASQYSSLWLYAPSGLWSTNPIANKTAAGWRYLQTDHLGTPQLAITNTGSASTQRRMAAFGSTREQGERQSARFPGQLEDPESGSFYNYFRDYEPGTGRYVESDPVGLRGGVGTYGYVLDNPLKYADPLGLFTVDESCNYCQFGENQADFVRRQAEIDCRMVAITITDFRLAQCITERCHNSGIIKCDGEYCQPGWSGYHTTRTVNGVVQDNPEIVYCLKDRNPVAYSYFGVATHEFAHSCGWDHGMGRGVPSDPPYPGPLR